MRMPKTKRSTEIHPCCALFVLDSALFLQLQEERQLSYTRVCVCIWCVAYALPFGLVQWERQLSYTCVCVMRGVRPPCWAHALPKPVSKGALVTGHHNSFCPV